MRHLGAVVVLLVALSLILVQLERVAGVGGIGANYGTGGGSESAEEWVRWLRSRGIVKIRLHDADSAMLRAIAGGMSSSSREAAMEVIVGMRNDEIPEVGMSLASAQRWVARNVVSYLPATKIIAIAVGNEVLSGAGAEGETIAPFLVPAMRNVHAALAEVGLKYQIKVSAPLSARVLSTHFPPSSAAFNGAVGDRFIAPLLEFLEASGSYFMLNLYPSDLRHDVTEPVESFSAGGGMKDPLTGLHYGGRVEALTAAVYVAMASLGHHQTNVVGIEMEWSRVSSLSSSSNAVLLDPAPRGLAADIDPKFVQDFMSNRPPQIEEKVRTKAFSSRRFLSDVLQGRQPESGKRRRLAPDKSWCVAKSGSGTQDLQSALDWACGTGGGVNCQPIQVGQGCFLPNDIVAHASYAFNSYYQKRSWASGSCDFGGLAQTTSNDPSTASCLYTSSTSSNGTPSTPTGTTVPSFASRIFWDRYCLMLTSCILIFLLKRTLSDLKI